MPISENIIDRVNAAEATDEEKRLMMEILQIEDKGIFRYEAAYEKAIKDYLTATDKKEDDE